MTDFKHIASNNDLRAVIKSAFDTDLALNGAWGYSKALATVIEKSKHTITLIQLEHTLASMRAYLEMHMTLKESERYGSINLNEKNREQVKEEGFIYDKVTYEITAIKENVYDAFINEYKEGYGKENFDLTDHFKRRKEATLNRVVTHWFEISKVI